MNIITGNSVSPSLLACLYVLAVIILQFSVSTFVSYTSLLLVDLWIPWLYAIFSQLQAVCDLQFSIIMLSFDHLRFLHLFYYRLLFVFKWINQPDAAISQVYYLSFKYSSARFGHPHAHHRELNNCCSLL